MENQALSVTSHATGSESNVTKVKEIWSAWDIRVLILLSLLIQVLLTFLAPLRKRSASSALKLILWLLYLSTTAIALYIISHISSNPDKSSEMVNLLAFWAPFLLLHLGGPDTITALALEDNELWHRHVLELVAQLGVTLYVFSYSVVRRRSPLLLPTALMFIDGGLKYYERVQALYYASIDSFRDSLETDPEPGPNYARLMDVFYSCSTANIPSEIQGRDDPSSEGARHVRNVSTTSVPDDRDFNRKDEDKMVIQAYGFYNLFKGLLADNFLSLKERKHCREIFMQKKGCESVRIIEIELNLMYDTFYTKVFLLDSKQAFLRLITFLSVIVSLLLFCLLDKSNYSMGDVAITYILLAGAIALDVCACAMYVSSDWFIIMNAKRVKLKQWRSHFTRTVLKISGIWRRPNRERWSRSISEYNLLGRCFKDSPSIIKYVGVRRIRDALTGFLHVTSDKTQEEPIVKFIVTELKKKATMVNDDDLEIIKEVCSARGNLFLEEDYFLISDYLQPWTTGVDYDESLLTWHLATDICYYTRTSSVADEAIRVLAQNSKKMSDYMSYLLLRQQTLVSAVVGMSDNRFIDTCAEAKKFMKTIQNFESDESRQQGEEKFIVFCKHLLNVHANVRPMVAKGDKSKSVLFEACRLAKQLKMLGEVKQWEITSKVWLELMCYTAVRCSPRSHLSQLRNGGELITLVWLLMAHLGFGDRFLQNQGFGSTKLVIQK